MPVIGSRVKVCPPLKVATQVGSKVCIIGLTGLCSLYNDTLGYAHTQGKAFM